MVSTRRKARAIALQAMYEIDAVSRKPEAVMERLLAESGLSEDNCEFVRRLVSGAVRHREEIDRRIQKFAPAYPVDQLALVDRNILRLAIYEILFDNSVPVKVAVNEAVELAKIFGSESSYRFVNGVLGAVCGLAQRKEPN
ncbi:MAG: transcription antitermination factor NusB [Dehalococcoidales bacterium]|nr:transcription antitermination factor NusB [Dehalococcoidales bacterium]